MENQGDKTLTLACLGHSMLKRPGMWWKIDFGCCKLVAPADMAKMINSYVTAVEYDSSLATQICGVK